MKAAVCEKYGPPEVVQIREVPTPVPAADEVLLRAFATTVNSGDAPYSRIKGSLKPGGRFLMVVGSLSQMIAATWQKATISASERDAATTADNDPTLMSLADEGVLKPVVDSVLPFEQIVDAYRRVDSGNKVGSVVLTFE